MNYVGIDIHKRYSVCVAQDQRGRPLGKTRIEGNAAAGFVEFFQGLGGRSKVVIEACWNWGKIYDTLEPLPQVAEVVLAHPLKTRLIADAQIKTDELDGDKLATLLRGNLIARAHVPPPAVRARKNLLRQRLYWARLRTRLRNRTHALLDRQHGLALPQCSDLFGAKGRHALAALELPEPDALLLREHLELLEVLRGQIKEQEKAIATDSAGEPMIARLASVPGIGLVLAPLIAAEIDTIARFRDPEHLCAYAGLVPGTHQSGDALYHGRLLWQCHKWLRWAFVEAAWVAIGCSPYFGDFYKRHRARGKKANTAITIVARRMCRIVFELLKQKRDYAPQPPARSGGGKNFPGRSRLGLAAS